jgi:uncharacterized membrane protein
MTEIVPFGALAAIAAMSFATLLTRLSGHWMMGRVTLTPRIRRMLEALPGSVVAALVMPVMVKEGLPATLAMIVVAALMIWRRNEFVALACGIAVAAGLRALY